MKALALMTVVSLMSGCASTTLKTDGRPLKEPLCGARGDAHTVSVLWGPKWRVDQKEPSLREAAALRGIQMFLDGQSCQKEVPIHRISIPDNHQALSESDLISMSAKLGPATDRIVVLVVRELGPKLLIGLPTLVEGGTEVVVESRVIDRRASTTMASMSTHWQKGGPFYIKGVKTLDQDMQTTLNAVFAPMARDSTP